MLARIALLLVLPALATASSAAEPVRDAMELPRATTYDDFSFFSQQVPGLYFNVGIAPDAAPGQVAPNHSPRFRLDEAGLLPGLRALLHVSFDYLGAN